MKLRQENDLYETPAWCVDRLLDAVPIYPGHILEPCCGSGAIVRALIARLGACAHQYHVNDLHTDYSGLIYDHPNVHGSPPNLDATVWTACKSGLDGVTVITNPPYNDAFRMAQSFVDVADTVILLMRLNWLASAERQQWLQDHTPSVYVLPNRPSFVHGRTDSTDYAWMVWDIVPPRIHILDSTPLSIRRGRP